MWRLFKGLIVLLGLGLIALAGYAYLFEESFRPAPREIVQPVTLDAG